MGTRMKTPDEELEELAHWDKFLGQDIQDLEQEQQGTPGRARILAGTWFQVRGPHGLLPTYGGLCRELAGLTARYGEP
jgi:hypothetical protein